MTETVVINPRYKDILSQYGFGSLDSFMKFEDGQIMDKNSKRCVYRLRLKESGANRYKIFYLKQFHKPSMKNDMLKILEYGFPRTEAKTEWINARILEEEGFNTIPLAAYGERTVAGFEKVSFFSIRRDPKRALHRRVVCVV